MTLDEVKDILIGDYMHHAGMSLDQACEHVDSIIASLERAVPGARIHVAKRRELPLDLIRRAMKNGTSMREIERQFHVDRRTVYRALDEFPA